MKVAPLFNKKSPKGGRPKGSGVLYSQHADLLALDDELRLLKTLDSDVLARRTLAAAEGLPADYDSTSRTANKVRQLKKKLVAQWLIPYALPFVDECISWNLPKDDNEPLSESACDAVKRRLVGWTNEPLTQQRLRIAAGGSYAWDIPMLG